MRWFIILGIAVATTCCGCESSGTRGTANIPVDQAAEKLKKSRDEYVAALKIDLDRADRDIDELKKKAAAASGDLKISMEKKIQELESHRVEAHVNFEEIKVDTHRAFEEMRTGMDRSWNALKDSVHRAKEDFK